MIPNTSFKCLKNMNFDKLYIKKIPKKKKKKKEEFNQNNHDDLWSL